MSKIILIIVVLLLSGCKSDKENEMIQNTFIKKYGSTNVIKCEEGILVNRYIAEAPTGDLYERMRVLMDVNRVPIRCNTKNAKEFVGLPTDTKLSIKE